MQTHTLNIQDNSTDLADKKTIDYWFDDRCERAVTSLITIQELYDDYAHYCQRREETALMIREFTREFPISAALCKKIRVYKRRSGKGMSFVGVRLIQKRAQEAVPEMVQKVAQEIVPEMVQKAVQKAVQELLQKGAVQEMLQKGRQEAG